MEPINSTPGSKKNKLRKWLKFLGLGATFLLALIFVSNWIWKMSGSNTWKLEIDKNGTKVYSLKTPGSSIKKIKGVTRYKHTLSTIVAPFFDEDIQNNCAEWAPGCQEYKILKPWNSKLQTNLQLWRFGLFPPFSTREILLFGQLRQDKQTKEIIIENMAAPNSIPPNDGYVRVTHMHNIWHYTPLANGEVDVEFIMDSDMAGAFPALLSNLGGTGQVYKMLQEDVPKSLNKEKYKNIKFDFIEEVAANK